MIIFNTQIIIKDIYTKKMKTTHISRIKKVTNARKPIENNKLRKKEKKLQTLGDFEVERIVDDRTDELGRKYYKVRWKGYPPTEDDWVKEQDMSCQELVERYYRQLGLDSQGKRVK